MRCLQLRTGSYGLVVLASLFAFCGRVRCQSLDQMISQMEADKDARADAKLKKQLAKFTGESGGERDAMPDLGAVSGDVDGTGVKLPPAPPRPKQLPVKRARAFARELLEALSTDVAKLDIAKAREAASKVPKARAYDEDEEESSHNQQNAKGSIPSAFLMHVGQVVDRLSRDAIAKYEFEGGFQQAMDSVSNAMKRKGDKELTACMEAVAGLFAEFPVGRSPELTVVAAGFSSGNIDKREAGMKTAEGLKDAATDVAVKTHIGEYIAAMGGVTVNGPSYIRQAILDAVSDVRRQEKSENRKLTPVERTLFDAKVEILMDFLSLTQRIEVEEDMSKPHRSEL